MRIVMRKIAIGLGLLAMFGSLWAGANAVFSYKSLPLGTSIAKFKKSNPEFHCVTRGSGRLQNCLSESSSYFGAKSDSIYVQFVDDKMSVVQVKFKFSKSKRPNHELIAQSMFIDIKKSLIERYGNPKTATEFSKNLHENGMSAYWETKDSSLVILVGDSELAKLGATDKTKIGQELTMEIEFELHKARAIGSEIYERDRKKDM